MRYGVRALCGVGATLALLTGCTSKSAGPASTAPPPGASATPAAAGTPGSCTDASDPRLRSVTLAAGTAGLTATWTSTGTDKAATAIWVVTVSGGSPNDYQLTVKATNGAAQSYVFNVDTSAQVAVPGPATVTSAGAAETFPWAALTGIGSDFTWNAVLNVDGTDVAYCPGDQSFLDFHR